MVRDAGLAHEQNSHSAKCNRSRSPLELLEPA
jgi:hypothetical protein